MKILFFLYGDVVLISDTIASGTTNRLYYDRVSLRGWDSGEGPLSGGLPSDGWLR